MSDWQLVSNHGLALICLMRNPCMTLREIGDCVGVTERTAQHVVNDLVEGGLVAKHREGTRNTYEIVASAPMRHRMFEGHTVGEALGKLAEVKAAPVGSARELTR